ncbi:MAG: hypothetical protein ACOX16_02740 [Candidatus Izemoplasmatales bacterium]
MDLSFLSYIDIIFYVLLGLAILMGLLRGFKKTLFTLITMAIFYIVFFVTVTPVSKALWSMQLPWLGQVLGNIDASLASFTSFEESLGAILQLAVGESIDIASVSPELLELATGIGIFVLKIIYTLLYFTVILLIYKIICLILRAIILGKTGKGESKNHGFGALVGIGNGIMAVFMAMVMLGGIMSIAESVVLLAPLGENGNPADLAMPDRSGLIELDHSVIPLQEENEEEGMSEEMLAVLADIKAMVEAYNNNLFVKIADKITTPSVVKKTEKVPLHLNLFDVILSFDYNSEIVAFRYELVVLSEAAIIFMESEYMETNNIADLTGSEIREVFALLGKSNLIISVMPLGIELAAQNFDQELPIPVEELYEIDFAAELPKVGAIAGALFDILNDAGFIAGEGEIEQIEITGDVVRELFEDMSESEVVVLLVEAILVPMIESEDSELGVILEIPAEVNWEEELVAIGGILGAIFDQEIGFQELLGDDPMIFLNAAASINVDLLIDSKLISNTLIRILSGEAGVEGLDFLEIPEGIVWLGENNQGELRNILIAMQTLIEVIGEEGFENITVNTIAGMTDEQIDDLFGSYVLVATISKMITEMDFGETPIVIPDSVFDDQDYLTATELKAVAKAVALILPEEGSEFDVASALSMDSSEIDIFLDSEIIAATVGKLIMDLEVEMLSIPAEVVTSVLVDGLAVNIVKDTEIVALLQSLSILELNDFETLAFDASILTKFASKTDPDVLDEDIVETFIASKIIHASVSSMIFDMGAGDSALLSVPSLDVLGKPLVTTVSGTDYLVSKEIIALFNSLYVLDLASFDDIDLEDTSLLIDNISVFLESAILHATISEQVLSIDDDILVVPYASGDSAPSTIRITKAETEYIAKTELVAFFDAVNQLGFANPTQFQTVFTLEDINDTAEQNLLLSSAIIHATISKKITDFGAGVLVVPSANSNGIVIRYETGPAGRKTEYLSKTEIKALIEALEVMGVVSIDGFSGAFSLANLASESAKDTLLASASMHATVSERIFDVNDNILFVPDKKQDGLTNLKVETGPVGSKQTFIVKAEIKAMINALLVMGFDDLSSFNTAFELSDGLFADANVVFQSSTIQAMFSDRIINDTGGTLQIPDKYYGTINLIKIALSDVTYIEYAELVALVSALGELGLNDFSGFSFNPAVIFELDSFDTILASEIIQATISDKLLTTPTLDETAPAGSGKLIVPSFFRQDITVETLASKQIEKAELNKLLTSLKLLGINNFSDGMSGTSITTIFMNETNRNTFLASGSIHATTDNLLKGNANIGGAIPALAKEDAYNIIGITTKAEIINFIIAVNTLGATDFTEANFTVASIAALDSNKQNAILNSMIVRNKITPDLETLCSINPLDQYPLTDADYMSGAARDFLKKQSILNIIDHYY